MNLFKPDKMKGSHSYTALIVEVRPDFFMGTILEVAGAASFAKSESELLTRLKDAVNCIHDSLRAENEEKATERFQIYGKPKLASIPCV